jgi:hypothetical protein
MSATPGSGRAALGLAALALSFGLACAAPASAEFFTPTEGFSDNGAAKFTFEVTPYLYLPHSSVTVGLDRPSQQDVTVGRGRPTLAEALAKLSFALDCDCLVRYGNFSAETDFIYVSLKQTTKVPALPPVLPEASLTNKIKVLFISPGLGYRVFSSDSYKIALDARVGFTYGALTSDSEFQLGQFSRSASPTISYAVPWIGERFTYYPSRRWRLENDFSITGLSANNGTIGYTGRLSASYAVNKLFNVQFGYAVQETHRNPDLRPDGTSHALSALLYGPVVGFGFRF